MMKKSHIHLRQHMEMNTLVIIVIWYHLLCFSTKIQLKVCLWITQLQRWVALMIIQMLLHVPKLLGEMVLLPFLLHVAQYITFRQVISFIPTLIADASLKSFYSSLGFKVIKDFATSPHFGVVRKRFHYKSEKSRAFQKQKNWLTISSNHPTTCYIYFWQ